MEPRPASSNGILLNTKLMRPEPRGPILSRPDLLARLAEGLTRKLTLVHGPTGFGKSTLVSAWLAGVSTPAAWFALDAGDNDPVRFWTYVVTALRRIDARVGKQALSLLAASPQAGDAMILGSLINDLTETPEPRLLVFEDYHAIDNPAVHTGLSYLLEHLPPDLHLILIARAEPDLPLAILRARDEMVEVDAGMLRLGRDETAALLRDLLRADLPDETVGLIYERTEGWAAGVRLAAMALKQSVGQDADRLARQFSGSHRFVADYLIQEVFARQPADIQDFLLKTSGLRRMCASLCDAVMESTASAEILDTLDKENLFISALNSDRRGQWYRYNPLFAEAIQTLARGRLGTDGLRAILARAGAWFEYHQMLEEAVEASLQAGTQERTLMLIETYIGIHSLAEMWTAKRWLESLPEDVLKTNPIISFNYAQVILFSGDRFDPATGRRMEPFLAASEESWRGAGNRAGMGMASALRAMTAFWQGDFAACLRWTDRSLEELPESEIFWRGVSLLNKGFDEFQNGRLTAAREILLEAKALLGAAGNIHGALAVDQYQAELFFMQGDFEPAAELAGQIIQQARGEESMLDDQASAHALLANIVYEGNDLDRAEDLLETARDLARRRHNEAVLVSAEMKFAKILTARGQADRALSVLRALSAGLMQPHDVLAVHRLEFEIALRCGLSEPLEPWLAEVGEGCRSFWESEAESCSFGLARWYVLRGDPRQALGAVEPWIAPAEANQRVFSLAEGFYLLALAHDRLGEHEKSAEALVRALRVGRAKGLRRVFLDQGPLFGEILKKSLADIDERPLRLYAAALVKTFAQDQPTQPPRLTDRLALVEPLSQQEIKVLKLLAAGLSYPEIAGELVVSTNTIKTQVKSIYRKLDVASRDEAREIARELRLLG